MAVTIIKEGRLKIPVFRATCPCCDCVFEFNKEDATLNEDSDGIFPIELSTLRASSMVM